MLTDLAYVASHEFSTNSSAEQVKLLAQQLRLHADTLRERLKNYSQDTKTKRQMLGLGALLAVQYSPADEIGLAKIGTETLAATNRPLIAAAAVATANFAEHYAAGRLANKVADSTVTSLESEFERPHTSQQTGRRRIGRYGVSLAFGTGVDIIWQRSRGRNPESSYPAKSAAAIASFNGVLAYAIAKGAERANLIDTIDQNLPGIVAAVGAAAITAGSYRQALAGRRHTADSSGLTVAS